MEEDLVSEQYEERQEKPTADFQLRSTKLPLGYYAIFKLNSFLRIIHSLIK